MDANVSGRELHLISSLVLSLRENGGFTTNLNGNSPTTGYALSIFPEREQVVPMDNEQALASALRLAFASVPDDSPAPVYVGGWVDGDLAYIDLSIVVSDLAQAVELGRQHGQLAIYDLATHQEIRLA